MMKYLKQKNWFELMVSHLKWIVAITHSHMWVIIIKGTWRESA